MPRARERTRLEARAKPSARLTPSGRATPSGWATPSGRTILPLRARTPLAVAVTLALLAACAGPAPRRPGAGVPSATVPPSARTEPGAGAPGARPRGGGYYLDDGPGDGPPPNLEAIPDAVPRAEPLLARANRPYTVFDRQYTPMTALAPYRERGVGSWYGRKYHGQRTSSGEVYDMYAMTAAHPTLPIPSYARVTNTRTGRAVVVRVNDRGPFLYGRVIDLSYTAAGKLGYLNSGSAEVEVELITRFDEAPAPAGAAVVATAGSVAIAPAAANAGTVASAPAVANSASAASAPAAANAATVANAPAAVPQMPAGPSARAPERLEVETMFASGAVVTPAPGLLSSASATTASATTALPSAASPMAVPTGTPVPTASPVAAGPAHYLQLGAFASRENAEAARVRIVRLLDWPVDRLALRNEGGLVKLQAGPYAQRAEALAAADRVQQATGFRPFTTQR